MKKFVTIGAVLGATFVLAACQANVTTNTAPVKAGNTAAPAPVAPAAPAGNAAAPVGGAAPTATPAGDSTNQNFTLNNQSARTITHVYVSPVTSENWGQDILGTTNVIPAGGNAQITFPRAESQCNWDVRVTIDNTENHELRNQNLCTTTELNYSE